MIDQFFFADATGCVIKDLPSERNHQMFPGPCLADELRFPYARVGSLVGFKIIFFREVSITVLLHIGDDFE